MCISSYVDSMPARKDKLVTQDEVNETMKESEQLDLAALAREKSEDMLGVLVSAANREKNPDDPDDESASWAVATSAAKTVIELGIGKTATQVHEKQEQGLTIVINQLTTGLTTEKVIEGSDLGAGIAKTIEITGAEVNLAQDLVEIVPVLSKPSKNQDAGSSS